MRRNIVRYAVLAYVITLKQVSIRVKKRFPTLQHIVDAGEYSNFDLCIDKTHKSAKCKTYRLNIYIVIIHK